MEEQVGSEKIFEGKIINVVKDHVKLENGAFAYREVVYHHGGVCILALENNQIILVKQFRYPNRLETLEIPAGKLEQNEDTKECAFREFEEETGYRANDMQFIMKVLPSPGYTNEWLYLYEAKDFAQVEDSLPCDEDEVIEILKLDLEEAYNKIVSGEIVDAKTVIAIMYAYNTRSNNLRQ